MDLWGGWEGHEGVPSYTVRTTYVRSETVYADAE